MKINPSKIIFTLIALAFIVVSIVSTTKDSKGIPNSTGDYTYRVEKVIDGDTMRVSKNGSEDTVRLLGINAPEASGPYRNEECYGQEASEYLRNILPSGSRVAIETDPTQDTRDQYDRLIAYVIRDDGLNMNKEMISTGHATEYTYKKRAYKNQYDFRQAERKAKRENLGLWGFCE